MSCFHNIKLKLKEVNTISEVSVDLGLKPGDRVGSLVSWIVVSVSLCKVTGSAEKLDPEGRRVVERSRVVLQGKTIIMLMRLIHGVRHHAKCLTLSSVDSSSDLTSPGAVTICFL